MGVGLCAILVLVVAILFAFVQGRRQNRAERVALDTLSQGLGMFDSAARLILCNRRYIEMSQLPSEIFQKGTPLREILIRRAQAGTFAGNPDQYVADTIKQAAEGLAEEKTFELQDGRTISLVFCPLADGGWVSTHSDVTKQRIAEKERDLLRQREDRRAAIETAIASFRSGVESVLLTVGHSAAS